MQPEPVTVMGGIFSKASDPQKMGEWYRENLGLPTENQHAQFAWRDKDCPDKIGRTVWPRLPTEQ